MVHTKILVVTPDCSVNEPRVVSFRINACILDPGGIKDKWYFLCGDPTKFTVDSSGESNNGVYCGIIDSNGLLASNGHDIKVKSGNIDQNSFFIVDSKGQRINNDFVVEIIAQIK